ncbi:hypothetical protein DVB69_15950 [Sporosarcina sp. BI001-red]|uniref:TIGR04104 family putative zinc finger protein n=1 Tax=Sporosarcina sp. BI001-red TaxID=2282866 RepID=UPI000E242CB1|nr:TIGR04104 family putative zinc finger protein [Sporosarcina sp. BI001-red]REB05245.1 hypothetical protein DVB69_15950 [Sporosarcina sp. BI001-red]
MDSIKDQLNTELQKITLDDMRKQEIIDNVKSSRESKTYEPVWKYRMVLMSFVLLSLTIAFINRKAPNVTQAEGGETRNILDLLAYDSVKTVMLAVLFLMFYGVLKRSIRKQGRALPACANCGTIWTHKLALKKAFGNEKTSCPNCGEENYQTRNSRKKTSVFQLLMPLIIIMANVFENGFYGFFIYLVFLLVLNICLVPYYVELQLDDPMDEPWW